MPSTAPADQIPSSQFDSIPDTIEAFRTPPLVSPSFPVPNLPLSPRPSLTPLPNLHRRRPIRRSPRRPVARERSGPHHRRRGRHDPTNGLHGALLVGPDLRAAS